MCMYVDAIGTARTPVLAIELHHRSGRSPDAPPHHFACEFMLAVGFDVWGWCLLNALARLLWLALSHNAYAGAVSNFAV